MSGPTFTNLHSAFAYYTECALATAEGLEMRKSAGKHETQRARSIADGMVTQCRAHGVQRDHLHRLPRLQKLLAEVQA